MKKADRIHSIISGLKLFSKLPDKLNVVGVDVGLKNFAICKFEVNRLEKNGIPKLLEWSKMDLHRVYSKNYIPLGIIAKNDLDYTNSNLIDSTRYLSFLSSQILNNHVFNTNNNFPTMVVMEHQRTRSQASTSTLPNVMKNVMLENMIYSSFYAMQNLIKNDSFNKSLVIPTSPSTMAFFWIHRYTRELNFDKKTLAKNVKSLRVKLVYQWIDELIETELQRNYKRTPVPFNLNPHSIKSIISDPDLQKKSFMNIKNKPLKLLEILNLDTSEISNFKIDDLIDSLLHALAYVKYYDNQEALCKALHECFRNEQNTKSIISNYIESTKKDQLQLIQGILPE